MPWEPRWTQGKGLLDSGVCSQLTVQWLKTHSGDGIKVSRTSFMPTWCENKHLTWCVTLCGSVSRDIRRNSLLKKKSTACSINEITKTFIISFHRQPGIKVDHVNSEVSHDSIQTISVKVRNMKEIPSVFLLYCKKHLTKHFICLFELTGPHYKQVPNNGNDTSHKSITSNILFIWNF